MSLTNGIYTVTNAFVTRNFGGVTTDVATVSSSTIVDNGGTTTPGITCAAGATVSNNIIARNAPQNLSASCAPTTSIVATDVSALHFVSPDVQPFDYHITAGSSAIDQAAPGVAHDFDGEHRPKGAAPDVGADEAQ